MAKFKIGDRVMWIDERMLSRPVFRATVVGKGLGSTSNPRWVVKIDRTLGGSRGMEASVDEATVQPESRSVKSYVCAKCGVEFANPRHAVVIGGKTYCEDCEYDVRRKLSLANSRAANADEWIGKTVEVKGVYWLTMGAVKAGTKFKVVEKNPNGGYDLKNLSGGAGMKGVFPKLMVVSNAARSRKAIVQKALNAVARNATGMTELEPSEKAKIKSVASGMRCDFTDDKYSMSGVIKHPKYPYLYIDFDVSKSESDGKPYYEWYVHAWNRTRKWERNGGQYKIEDAVSAAAQAMRGAKQMIEKWAGGVPLNADTSVLRETAVNAKFKVGDRVGIRNYNGTTWYAKIVSIKSPSEYRVDGIGKSSGLHMDVDEVEIKYVLKKDADGDLVYTPVNSVSNGVGVFDGAYVVERTSRDGKFKVYLVNPPNKKPLAEFATREEAERFLDDMEKKQSSGVRTTNAVVAKALNARAVCNASYSAALKAIMDAVKPYMDRRITDDTSWRYPALVISKLRDVCERAVMSAGRYDGKRPPNRVYDVECVKDGFKFSGNLIVSGLLHRDDPDDVSAFDEYDMILSLGYAGKA